MSIRPVGKTYTHRVVQLLSGLAGLTGGGAVVVTDAHDLAGWLALVTGAIVGLVTLYRQISDAATPTRPNNPIPPIWPPAP